MVFTNNYPPKWWRLGTTKVDVQRAPRESPKKRLSEVEVHMLSLFEAQKIVSREKGISMLQVLRVHGEIWPDDKLTTSTASRYLQVLKENFFLSGTSGQPIMVNQTEERYGHKKKALFWLSEKVQNGAVRIDQGRWVISQDEYVASEKYRLKAMTRENRAMKSHADVA